MLGAEKGVNGSWSALIAAQTDNKRASPGQGDLDLCLYLFLMPESVTGLVLP